MRVGVSGTGEVVCEHVEGWELGGVNIGGWRAVGSTRIGVYVMSVRVYVSFGVCCVWVQMPQRTWCQRAALWSQLFPSTMWLQGLELRWSAALPTESPPWLRLFICLFFTLKTRDNRAFPFKVSNATALTFSTLFDARWGFCNTCYNSLSYKGSSEGQTAEVNYPRSQNTWIHAKYFKLCRYSFISQDESFLLWDKKRQATWVFQVGKFMTKKGDFSGKS